MVPGMNWALPLGLCLLSKSHDTITGLEVKYHWDRLRNKCGQCGSVDLPGGGELTLNYVANIEIDCPARNVDSGPLYNGGLCWGRGLPNVEANLPDGWRRYFEWENQYCLEWRWDEGKESRCVKWQFPGENPE